MSVIYKVRWEKRVAKQLQKLPEAIHLKFYAWVQSVELSGLQKTRECVGFHDEALKGKRLGQRSVRLNRAYRAIYLQRDDGVIDFVEVIEVNKHEY